VAPPPHFLIIGAQRCGTHSLRRWLGESSAVELPPAKEIHFFDLKFERGLDWYRSRFPERRGAITGEASPYYVFHPLAPRRIGELLPDVQLIVLLRDPVERAVSHYHHSVAKGFEPLELSEALDREPERLAGEADRIVAEPAYRSAPHRNFSYQARGLYADQLERWRSLFPADQLLAVHSERLFARPREQTGRVCEFLGIPPIELADAPAYGGRNYAPAPPQVEKRLRDRFAAPNERLYELVGDDFGWNRQPEPGL